MNKNDKLLLIIILPILLIIILIFKLSVSKSKIAYVYYENKIILKIDLSLDEKEYNVRGYNGNVKIMAGNGKVKVLEEESNKHICSNQGYIESSHETIICLPNKIIIKIASNDELDATL